MTDFPYPESYHEFYGDIFDHFESRLRGIPVPYIRKPESFYLVQTVSGDCKMGLGIAKEINDRYGFKDIVMNDKLQRPPFRIGAVIEPKGAPHLMALVTKNLYFEKPTLDTMRCALGTLKDRLFIERCIHKTDPIEIIMPTIGCGLDKLQWDDVKEIIFDVFGEYMSQGWLIITVVKWRNQHYQ